MPQPGGALMNSAHVFISHATIDDGFVKELREQLESSGILVWVDSRNLRGGTKLAPEISEAIEQARQTIVVFSPHTINSPWVRKEIQQALAVEKQRKDEGYRVIPLLLPGIEPSALPLWFDEEPVGIRIELTVGSVSEALPQILAALGERLPEDQEPAPPPARPVAELKLKLRDAVLEEIEKGKWRVRAKAQLIYDPADPARPAAESSEFKFTAPLGVIEADDLRWYLEKYYLWPTAFFTERARDIEKQLPQWGQQLYGAATAAQSARELLADWQQTHQDVERRFSIYVDSRALEGSSADEQKAAHEAGNALLALPWELMHDGRGFLFQGANPVRVRRCLPKQHTEKAVTSKLPIRILLVSPRPEDKLAAYIDHRISARPLVEAVEELGELAELTALDPPTLPALRQALQRAREVNCPFDIIHFDGHGVYDRQRGLGALCFEDPKDGDKPEKRASALVGADELGALVREHRIPLVFLEACQSAAEAQPEASVAVKLLDEGVTSIVAMTHSVLVETARRFVTAFYRTLAEGRRVGTAMLEGQHALYNEPFRFRVMGAGELRLQDWFVPVLYQEEHDLQLITRLLPEQVKALAERRRRLSLGALPEPPHGFVGRSRELLKLQRLLGQTQQRYLVVRGRGGEGKTTLAAELARWLVRTCRFERAAFVSLEHYTDARGVLDALGRQLLPEGERWSVAQFKDFSEARQHVERALRDHRTIVVLDNLESVLPSNYGVQSTGFSRNAHAAEPLPPEGGTLNTVSASAAAHDSPAAEIFALCQALLDADSATRLVFTSRESKQLPKPFNHAHRTVELRELDRSDAIELVSEVLKREGLEPKYDDAGNTPQEIEELVAAVGCHARALTLLARETARQGVRATTANVRRLMAELERKHPGDRENSLYASVELSLRRLPPDLREQVKALAVFHGGAHLMVLDQVLETAADDVETVQRLAAALIEVGLAEAMPYGHLRLDPALPNYLLAQMDAAELPSLTARWAEAMRALTGFLYQQAFQDTQLAFQLTLLELTNLLAMLNLAADALPPEQVVGLASRVETLLAQLGRPQALAQAVSVRAAAAQRLGARSHAQFLNAGNNIDRLLEQGDLQSAYAAAQQLLERCLSAGAEAYPGAAYDIAMAHWRLGRVLKTGGAAEEALSPLAESQQQFKELADAGITSAAGMAAGAIRERADCLRDLGRYEEAAAAYEEGIRRAEELGDRRGAAVGKGQLGTVRLQQKRYAEALERYAEALKTFESLGEPGSVATAWHQIGRVHSQAGQLEQAEQAYRQALAIRVQHKLRADEAASLNELGNLYDQMGRLEEAVTFYRQGAEIYAQLQILRYEGVAHSNLADTLIKLQRYDEARQALLRAIECRKHLGHAAELWKTWGILHDLEQATGNAQAAAEARGQAAASYLAYRRAGGESQSNAAGLFALVFQAIQQGTTTEAESKLDELAKREFPLWAKTLVAKLHLILGGDRAPALAADPNMDYMNAAELQLLLEKLGAK
jgi:tetratricopeptide (TPR) repeat protein/DNA polymerase III delta prime subunit